jgi:hypothetical protein
VVSELERKLPSPPAPRPTFVGGNVRRRALIHRLADADEVQRLGFNERQTRLEDGPPDGWYSFMA